MNEVFTLLCLGIVLDVILTYRFYRLGKVLEYKSNQKLPIQEIKDRILRLEHLQSIIRVSQPITLVLFILIAIVALGMIRNV